MNEKKPKLQMLPIELLRAKEIGNKIHLAYFDVLGFEKMVRTLGLEKMCSIYEKLIDLVNKQKGDYGYLENSTDLCGEDNENRHFFQGLKGQKFWALADIHSYYVSDSISIWTPYSHKTNDLFLDICMNFFCNALKLGLPLRGCIGYGSAKFDIERNIFLGTPLIDCARGEATQNWAGISFSSNTLDSDSLNPTQGYKYTNLNKIFPIHDQHIKEECKTKQLTSPFALWEYKDKRLLSPFALDWPRYWRENKMGDIKKVIGKINTDPKFSEKYDMALEFYELSEKNGNWYEMPIWKRIFGLD